MGFVVAERNGARLTLRARELRGERSLGEAAALVGIRQDELSRIERGETSAMRFDTLLRLCEAYHVRPGELLDVEQDSTQMSPLDRVLAAVSVGTATTHRPPTRRRRLTDDDLTVDLADADRVIGTRHVEVERARRQAPRTVGPSDD